MKTSRVILILLLSVIISVFAFYTKWSKTNDDIDNLAIALSTSQRFIKPGSSIVFTGEADKPELFFWSRYILVPARLVLTKSIGMDTLLSIKYNTTDTLPAPGQIIWQHRDKLYHYTLTTTLP